MSIASSPNRILHVGVIRPEIRELAAAIQHAGWRVTSIYRPTGVTHPHGIALDAAPLVYVRGGFGLKTARLLWQFAHSTVPGACWLAVAEADHIHVQLFHHDSIGINTPKGTELFPTQGSST